MEQEWAAYNFSYPLVVDMKFTIQLRVLWCLNKVIHREDIEEIDGRFFQQNLQQM